MLVGKCRYGEEQWGWGHLHHCVVCVQPTREVAIHGRGREDRTVALGGAPSTMAAAGCFGSHGGWGRGSRRNMAMDRGGQKTRDPNPEPENPEPEPVLPETRYP
jgi:hypothetical protein